MQWFSVRDTAKISILFLPFLSLHLRHMEVPRLGVQTELQLPTYVKPQQSQIQAETVTYTAVQVNTGSLTH